MKEWERVVTGAGTSRRRTATGKELKARLRDRRRRDGGYTATGKELKAGMRVELVINDHYV